MLYQQSYGIERRLEAVFRLIRSGTFSTPKIADALGVSVPTVSPDVLALRQRGFEIRAKRGGQGWRYTLERGQRLLRIQERDAVPAIAADIQGRG